MRQDFCYGLVDVIVASEGGWRDMNVYSIFWGDFQKCTMTDMMGAFCNTLGVQVCDFDLLWDCKFVNRTYFGLFGARGYS